jgi:hypothetical protein
MTDTDTTTTEHRSELTARGMLMSLNGFDEIAIAAHFGQKIADMRDEDAITTGRALAFVHLRRSGSHGTDRDAHTAALHLTMQEVMDYFTPEPKGDDATQGDPEAAASALGEDMAAWCVGTGFAPSEWKSLTQGERNAIARAHNDAVQRARG